jgi:hypothetical protein
MTVAILLAVSGCKDPDEYDPTEPLDPPPAPPTLIMPLPDTSINSSASSVSVLFDWNTISVAEMYEIQVDSNLTFRTAQFVQIAQPPTYITLYRYASTATYYARIRAGSSGWANYTEWSEPRRFFLRPEG